MLSHLVIWTHGFGSFSWILNNFTGIDDSLNFSSVFFCWVLICSHAHVVRLLYINVLCFHWQVKLFIAMHLSISQELSFQATTLFTMISIFESMALDLLFMYYIGGTQFTF